jgi:uncharacterized membrane protein YkvA (DUF1232 family)
MILFSKISSWAKALKLDVLALWFALKNPTMPFWAKVVCFIAVAYALSPVDLIPDFIPVLGYLDDLIIVPALVWLALKLIPTEVMNLAREQAVEWINSNQSKPKSYVGLTIVVVIWLICLAIAARYMGY